MFKKISATLVAMSMILSACGGGGGLESDSSNLETQKKPETIKPQPKPMKPAEPDSIADTDTDTDTTNTNTNNEPAPGGVNPVDDDSVAGSSDGQSGTTTGETQESDEPKRKKKNSDRKKGLLFGGLGVLAGVLGTLGIQKLSKSNKEKKAEENKEGDETPAAESKEGFEVIASGITARPLPPSPQVAGAPEGSPSEGSAPVGSSDGDPQTPTEPQLTKVIEYKVKENTLEGETESRLIVERDNAGNYSYTMHSPSEEPSKVPELRALQILSSQPDEVVEMDESQLAAWNQRREDLMGIDDPAKALILSLDDGLLAPDAISIHQSQEAEGLSSFAVVRMPEGSFGPPLSVGVDNVSLREFERRGVQVPAEERMATTNP